MVDRQDIDALLIGSLYGELSSTEEARLSAHLDSHPADRTALANLTRAREVVRESRILQVQFDPPQSVSALLMQEAVRRAPKPREEQSWFQRFMRSFIVHPAMAAAATLVLVVGVAGTVYMKKGDNFAKATKDNAPALSTAPSTPSTDTPAGPTADTPAAAPAERPAANGGELGKTDGIGNGRQLAQQGSATDDYQVKLDDAEEEGAKPTDRIVVAEDRTRAEKANKQEQASNELGYRGGVDKNRDAARPAKPDTGASKDSTVADVDRAETLKTDPVVVGKPKPEPTKATEPKVATSAKPPQKAPPRLEVTTPSPAPKDFGTSVDLRKGEATGAGVASRSDARPGNASPPPPPPPPPPAPTTVATDEKETKAQERAATELAWAKEQHGKLLAAVKAGKCDLAATIASGIATRNASYYSTVVVDDRGIKSCAQYINAQREREAERAQRAKSTQRRAADEAPAPAPTQSTK